MRVEESGSLLETILSPACLKTFSHSDLQRLSVEIRQRIIDVLSVTGGHLASNLGMVELTVALHRVFQAPTDRFIFDVSHQTYAHKLLTGRNADFPSLRQWGGVCGFSNPKESLYDHFYAGHAGTALSLALGVAKARDLNGSDEYVIPVIGDATLTCGLALEALNNISRQLKKFVVILNDNAMSISENVGAITHILSRLLSNPTTNKLYHEVESVLSKIPTVGPLLAHQGQKITESLKNLVSPAVFFEQYGLAYIGPIDGHDIKKLLDTFEGVKELPWPVVIHVLTTKGKGMEEAVKNPVSYHGARPFSKDTGKFLPNPSSQPTFPKIFGAHLLDMARRDPDLVAITPAMSAGSCLDEMMRLFPDRCLDVGIAESHAVTFAGGLAFRSGKKVLVSIYSTFLQRALDPLFHDVCLQGLPVVFAIDRAGISGPDGPTHHGIYDLSFLQAMPNLVIAQPRDGRVLQELLESSFAWNRPSAIRYPNLPTQVGEPLPLIHREMGKGEVLVQGKGVLIVALGHMNEVAQKAMELLAKQGIFPTLLDPVFVKPLDEELLLALLKEHTQVVTIEEHSVVAGLGSCIRSFLAKMGIFSIDLLSLGIPDRFVDHGAYPDILEDVGLTPPQIAAAIVHWCQSLAGAL